MKSPAVLMPLCSCKCRLPDSTQMFVFFCASAALQVERSSDDTVKLKILQTALTLLQNPSNADDQVHFSDAV